MKVLVTGANGFIGREIVSELIRKRHQLIGMGRSGKSFDDAAEFVQADICDKKSLEKLGEIAGIDVIVHSAGLAHQFGETTKEEFDAVNVTGTENILKRAVENSVKHFILIGSTAIYGNQNDLPKTDSNSKINSIDETTTINPPTLYAESKLAGERVCQQICEENQLPLTIFRLAPVIGEDNTGNVARLIEAIDRNRFVWIGDGRNLKSLIYKNDVARACAELIEKKKNGTEIFNLAAEPIVLKDFVAMIARHLNKKILPVKIPASLPRLIFRLNKKLFNLNKIDRISATVEKWLADDVYSADRIAAEYDFRAAMPISEAIARQVEFYKQNKQRTSV